MTQPPSFEPRKRRNRPSAQGARRVGRPAQARPVPPSATSAGRPRRAATPTPPSPSAPPPPPVVIPPASTPRSSARPNGPRGPIRRSAFTEAPPATQRPAPAVPPQQPVTPVPHRTPSSIPPRSIPSDQPQSISRSTPPASSSPALGTTGGASRGASARTWRFYARSTGIVALCFIVAVLVWIYYLYSFGDSHITRLSALTGRPDTPGTTYLIVGSDERGGVVSDPTEGHRADTIMLLQVPESGTTSLVSIPRDTLVEYPDGDSGKINAALNIGGYEYLVGTVESLTGLTVDHYVQIGMDGVKQLTDAVGGVNLCLDYDVDDPYSTLVWQAGCHDVDGTTALAFSRMRYEDPLGDIGRTARQRQVVSKIISKAASTSTFLNPFKQRELVGAASDVLTVDTNDSLFDVAWAGLALRSAMGPDGAMGAPPISSLNYTGYDGASYVLLDEDAAPAFWSQVTDGSVTKDSFASF